MADRISLTVYDQRDNEDVLVVLVDDVPVADLSTITRVVVTVGGVAVDSNNVLFQDLIWWDDQREYNGQLVDVIKMKLGLASIPKGVYTDGCLILFDSTHPDGVIYSNNMKIKVVAGCSI